MFISGKEVVPGGAKTWEVKLLRLMNKVGIIRRPGTVHAVTTQSGTIFVLVLL